MSDRNASANSGRNKTTRFAAPAAPSEATIKHTRVSRISVARDHVNFHAVTLHDKLEKIVVCCAAYFMKRSQNLHYKISSQQKMKTDNEYVPKSSQIKLELDFEKGTNEGEASKPSQRSTHKSSPSVS